MPLGVKKKVYHTEIQFFNKKRKKKRRQGEKLLEIEIFNQTDKNTSTIIKQLILPQKIVFNDETGIRKRNKSR